MLILPAINHPLHSVPALILNISKSELNLYTHSENKIEIDEIRLSHVGNYCPITEGKLLNQKINRFIDSAGAFIVTIHFFDTVPEPVWD
jgi:hypothetical protein